MSESDMSNINIRPGVSILSILKHLNYKPWFAMAEFVDNSVQSYIEYRELLKQLHSENYQLCVTIETDITDHGRIVIRDNAAGIHSEDYPRAFRPAAIPPDQSGLSEFGMGMKSAACWFAHRWMVRTSALGEDVERVVSFDVDQIVKDSLEELEVEVYPADANAHYTEITLFDLHKPPQGRTIAKIKDHLASIYRVFIRDGILRLEYDGETLSYEDPDILEAPPFDDLQGEALCWHKSIDFDFGKGLRVQGFAALRATASVSRAGFALFRRGRVIQGSADEGYRPEYIFKKSNSYTYQRLFGELHLQGFEVSHTKDGFRWDENEHAFLELLREHLDSDPLPLIRQAEGHRARPRPERIREAAESATERTADTIRREVPRILPPQIKAGPMLEAPLAQFEEATSLTQRVIELQVGLTSWEITLELTNEPAVGDWIDYSDHYQAVRHAPNGKHRKLGIRLTTSHPFMVRYVGDDDARLEAVLRVAVALVLAEITARESGVKYAGTIRRNINSLLKDALSKP